MQKSAPNGAAQAFAALALLVVGSGCGYVGEPLPPALHIPQRVGDLSAVERGGQIHVQFTLPSQTTENLDISKPVRAELRIGTYGNPFDLESWLAGARAFDDIPTGQAAVYNAAGTLQSGAHVVIGRNTSTGTTIPITLAGSAAFTSSTSYQCVATSQTASSLNITYTSGTAFTIAGVTNTEVIAWHCIGN